MSLPIVKREVLAALRTRRALTILLVLTFCSSMIVLLRWPTDGQVDISGARAQQIFQVFAYTLLAAVLFVTPSFPATSIVQEKNRGTLTLLLNSPLQSWSIYFGKFTGSVIFAVLMLLTSVPAAAACFAMGGLDLLEQVGLLYLVLLMCVVQYTTISLLVSSLTQSTDAAVRVTYAVVFAIGVLSIGPYFLLQGKTSVLSAIAPWLRVLGGQQLLDNSLFAFAWWLRAASPIPIVMEIVGHGAVGDLGIHQGVSTLRYFFVIAGLTSAGCAVVTISRLNFRIFDRSRSKGTVTEERGLGMRWVRRLVFLVDPQRRKMGIPFYLNPVMVKEFRTRRFGRAHWLMRLVAGCAVLSLVLALAATAEVGDWGPETIGGFMVLLQIVLIVLIVPSLTAGLISTERETGGWELLRMTPLSTFRIVLGKLLSVVWTVALILLATLPGYLVMIWIKPDMWKQVQLVLICLGLAAIYTVCVGAAIGALFRRTTTATMTCYVVLIVVFLGPLLIWMGKDAPFSHDVVETALTINPTGAALNIIEAPGFSSYELTQSAWTVSAVVSCVALSILSLQVWRITRPL